MSANRIPVPLIACAICGQPVDISEAKTDGEGRAVHEECFVSKVISKPSE